MISAIDESSADKDLVEAVKKNDGEAFKILYYRYFNMLIRFANYRLRSEETSCDLVQEIFLNIWRDRKKLKPDKSIKSYLYKSLNNRIINHFKLSSSKNYSLEKRIFNKKLYTENNFDSAIDVQNALEKLPGKLKLVYTLSRLEGYKYAEIAEICKISVKAVEKRMSQAFVLLKKYFSESRPNI